MSHPNPHFDPENVMPGDVVGKIDEETEGKIERDEYDSRVDKDNPFLKDI